MLFGQGASQAAGGAWLAGGIVDGSIRGERMGVLRSREDGACSSRTWGGAKADAAGYGDGLRGRAWGARGVSGKHGETSADRGMREKRGRASGHDQAQLPRASGR